MNPHRIHILYTNLLKEQPEHAIAWGQRGRVFTFGQMLAEVEQGSDQGVAYAQAVLASTLRFVCEKHLDSLTPDLLLQIDVSPRIPVTAAYRSMPADLEVWRTMSSRHTAHDMAADLDALDAYAKSLLSDLLRISRDVVARQGALRTEAA